MQDFHGRYYHPSNARFWFYGDDPADERLRLLSKYLDEFEARPVDSTVHAQPLHQVMLDHALCAVCHGPIACLCAVLLQVDLLRGFAG
jgi:Zn-dependent M16 (insulinase) family peptidase